VLAIRQSGVFFVFINGFKMIRKLILFFVFAVCIVITTLHLNAQALPKVMQSAVDELGITSGTPQRSGFVFVEGKYLTLPYTVTRRGNAIFVNRVQIEQPVAWTSFVKKTKADPLPVAPRTIAAADLSIRINQQTNPPPTLNSESTKVSSIDQLFSDIPEKAEPVNSIDELFDDPDTDDKRPADEKSPVIDIALDDLCSDQDPDQQKPEPPVNPVQISQANPQTPEVVLSEAQLMERKQILKKYLDAKRASYERALAKGELFFFGKSHNRLNGTYGSARSMLNVLPSALRYSRSSVELLKRLKAGHVYFIDASVCQALYRNRTTFPLLQQRLDRIKQMEKVRNSRRRN